MWVAKCGVNIHTVFSLFKQVGSCVLQVGPI